MSKFVKYFLGASVGILTASALLGFRPLRRRKMNPAIIKGKNVLFVGDSHTALYGSGWQSIIAKKYGFYEKNTAVGGKRTDWMIGQLKLALMDGTNYYACFIYGGANDAYSGVTNQKAVANIQEMVNMCIAKNVIPIVIIGYNTMKVSYGNTALKPTSYVPTQQGMWDLAKKRYEQQLLMQSSIKDAFVIPMWNDVSHATAPNDGLHIYGQNQKNFASYIESQLFTK